MDVLKLSLEQQHAISSLIQQRFGLFFSPERFADMLRAVSKAAVESGYYDIVMYAEWLLSWWHSDEQLEPLITNLTIGETYFFRDSTLFSGLSKVVFPEIAKSVRADKAVRLWCAACSTGEEAYSVAMLLDRVKPFPADWQTKLYATDINVKSLAKARVATYSQWSFRGVASDLRADYFENHANGQWKLKKNIRQMVEFAPLNLVQSQLVVGSNDSARFDVILCRNVLMYFSAKWRRQILNNLTAMLADNGWLVVSPSEVGLVDVEQLSVVDADGMLIHRRGQSPNKRTTIYPQLKSAPALLPLSSLCALQGSRLSQLQRALRHQENATNASIISKVINPAQFVSAKVVVEMSPGRQKKDVSPRAEVLSTAQVLMQQHEYHQAIATLEPLVLSSLPQYAKDVARPMLLLGRCLANVGELEKAEQWLEKGLQLDRLNSSSYYLLATVQQELGKREQAQKSLEQALYLDPEYIIATFSLGMLLRQVQHEEQGSKLFRRARLLLARMEADAMVPDSEDLTVAHLQNLLDDLI